MIIEHEAKPKTPLMSLLRESQEHLLMNWVEVNNIDEKSVQGGEIDRAEPFLESFNDSFNTYKKFQREWSKYGK